MTIARAALLDPCPPLVRRPARTWAALTATERADPRVILLHEVHLLDGHTRRGATLPSRHLLVPGRVVDQLAHRDVARQSGFLGKPSGDSVVLPSGCPRCVSVLTSAQEEPTGRRLDPREHSDQAALALTVVTHEGRDPQRERQRRRLDDLLAPIRDLHVPQRDMEVGRTCRQNLELQAPQASGTLFRTRQILARTPWNSLHGQFIHVVMMRPLFPTFVSDVTLLV